MASLQRYSVRGKKYYRIVESRRIDGKPRPIPIAHLGSAEQLLERLTQCPELTVKSYSHGAVAALLQIAEELELVKIINRHLPTSRRGIGAGEVLLLVALNRAHDPCSKRSLKDWTEETSLLRLLPHLSSVKFSSQLFWDHMQDFTPKVLGQIEDELVQQAVKKFGLTLDLLFFDTTNCYTYIDDEHPENELFQYGHSKERQDQRRLFGVALLVTRHGTVPLYHHTYPGNQHDSRQLPRLAQTLCARLERIGLKAEDVTLVFDRGNLSQENFKHLDSDGLGFVTALRLGDIPRELFDIPLQHSRLLKRGEKKGLRYLVKTLPLWGAERKAVFYLSVAARQYQTQVLNDQIRRKLAELNEWSAALRNQSGRSDGTLTDVAIAKRIATLQSGPYLKEIIDIQYDPHLPREKRLQYSINEKAKNEIIEKYFGKRCIITNKMEWDAPQIVSAYFSQAQVERAFRLSKDRHHITLRPQFHWTDQSVRVHTFSCFVALLLGQLMLLRAQKVDSSLVSTPALIDTLAKIRLAAITTLTLKKPTVTWKIEALDSRSQLLLRTLAPTQAFQYATTSL